VPIKLLICTPTAVLHGGVERIVESLATHLPSRGFDVRFALAKGRRFHDPDAFRRALPAIEGVDIDGTSGTIYGRQRALKRAMIELDPDVVLIARMFDAYPVAAELKRAGHRLRLAVTVQAYEADYFIDLARYAAFVDVCVASGAHIANAVQRFTDVPVVNVPGGVAPPRRTSVPRYLGTSANGQDASRGTEVPEVPRYPLRLGYVGRIEQKQKRLLDLPLLAAELERRGVPFTIDLAGTGSVLDEVIARTPNVRVHGWLSTEDLYERVYPELDVFVHFAEWEGVTIAPREAMAHGVVPVVSRFIGLEEEGQLVDEVNALTFPVGDIRAAADAIERLHRDRALVARLSENARASQTGIRSEQGAIDAWASAFRDALAREARIGDALPQGPRDKGMLTRLRVPPSIAELVRRARPRIDAEPGGEWPHWSGIDDPELRARLASPQR
jgi:glycosyltransferase involved in cell wall biosynthesis